MVLEPLRISYLIICNKQNNFFHEYALFIILLARIQFLGGLATSFDELKIQCAA